MSGRQTQKISVSTSLLSEEEEEKEEEKNNRIPSPRSRRENRRNQDAFSSSSSSSQSRSRSRSRSRSSSRSSGSSHDENSGNSDGNSTSEHEDDYFSNDDEDDDEGAIISKASSKGSFVSEFDRALHRGKLSTGILGPVPSPPPPPPPPAKGQSDESVTSNKASNSNHQEDYQRHQQQQQQQQQQQEEEQQQQQQQHQHHENPIVTSASRHDDTEDPLSSGVLPDVLMTMRQKIESLTMFDSDMMKLAQGDSSLAIRGPFDYGDEGEIDRETRESLKRSSQQSISAAVLVSLAHKRYERRRLAAMEIEKVVRSLVQQLELERVRAILLLLSDDYVRSTSEDARKGGVVALAASAIGLKKAPDILMTTECRDLILASVVHACQDHSQRVRYYATESLFNVVKVIPSLAVQHFFILFEILRSLYADVDLDVKSGAELLDKKLKEVIVGAMNSGQFTADACVPVFARFVYMRNKATKRLTLTWLQELAEKLIGAPILEFLHLLLAGIFDMVADPTLAIRQSALAFLQSVLPKLLTIENHVQDEAIDDMEQGGMKVDFDKILQSLVTTMEHPDPFVRKVAMYWMSRIVKAHIGGRVEEGNDMNLKETENAKVPQLSAATISVRNSLPHVLPGILLSIGDTFKSNTTIKDSFLPDQTTHVLAEQTNATLQQAVRREGHAYVHHLDSFIVALREELDSPGGVNARNPPAVERKPYRMDVKHDGTGIESQGWFRASNETKQEDENSMMMSRLCALQWVIVLYTNVVPDVLKADYAREFVISIIHQLVDDPPNQIIFKSLEVLATISVPVKGEASYTTGYSTPSPRLHSIGEGEGNESPMKEASVLFALEILDDRQRLLQSRDREVFSAIIQLLSHNLHLIGNAAKVIAYMCQLQPPEFVLVSFAVELEKFATEQARAEMDSKHNKMMSKNLQYVSSFIQQMCHVLLNSREAKSLRDCLKDCIGHRSDSERDQRRSQLFYILLHCFSHNLISSTALCLWGGAYRTAYLFLSKIDPLDIHLMFLLEVDKLIELIERPICRHLHVRMLETEKDPFSEGSGLMLFQVLKSLLMIIPQSTCFNILRTRLTSTARFRQSAMLVNSAGIAREAPSETNRLVERVLEIRKMHCSALWNTIRAESLELTSLRSGEEDNKSESFEEGQDRREWLGFASKEEEATAMKQHRDNKLRRSNSGFAVEELDEQYKDLNTSTNEGEANVFLPNSQENESWKEFWSRDGSMKGTSEP